MTTKKALKKARKFAFKSLKKKHVRDSVMAIGGVGAGALMMYLFDPRLGSARRMAIVDTATGFAGNLRDAVGSAADDLKSRAGELTGQPARSNAADGHGLSATAH